MGAMGVVGWKPANDGVLVKMVDMVPAEEKDSLIVRPAVSKGRPTVGEVIAVGPAQETYRVGDVVLFAAMGGFESEALGTGYKLLFGREVLAVLEPTVKQHEEEMEPEPAEVASPEELQELIDKHDVVVPSLKV